MKTASQILEAKGYDNEEQNAIVYDHPSLDAQVRSEFGIDEPVHLWDGYYIGDADEDILTEIATSKGYDNYFELFRDMDYRLIELANEYPEKD